MLKQYTMKRGDSRQDEACGLSMDLSYTPEYESYREDVQAFLASQWRGRSSKADLRAFLKAAVEAGYLWRHVPRHYGGGERPFDPLEATIIQEEFAKARAPTSPPGLGRLVMGALLAHGAEWQKDKFVEATVLGDITWCQGFSEPGAGSDLAAVGTRAVLEDGQWVIDGQKIWTSYAHRADYMFALVKTEPDQPRHAGISYLLIDMKQPGIEVRPLRQMTGGASFNEVFLTGATTPADHILGGRGEGWQVKSATLAVERAGNAGAPSVALFRRLLKLAESSVRNGAPALEDREVRQWLADLEARALAHLYSGYRMFTRQRKGEDAGLFPMMNKLYSTEFVGMEAARIARELIGDDGLLLAPPRRQADWPQYGDRPIGKETWNSTALTLLSNLIAAGTSNIQRNVISERGYGLPRES